MSSGATFEQEGIRTAVPKSPFLPLKKKNLPDQDFKKDKVLLIAGPTAVGKTELSLALAKLVGGEIVSADSMQVYRGMNIGTAKVSAAERAEVPHHLIDIRHVRESFNVVDFYYAAKGAIRSITARNRVPIIVGGSGFYFRALLHGPPKGPPPQYELRAELEKELERLGLEQMYERLQEVDPDYASTITCNDRVKIIRALEIITVTGKKVSSISWSREEEMSDYDYRAWFCYRPRPVLNGRINARCDAMLSQGLVDEVKRLDAEGIRDNPSAAQAIGYRQCLEYLLGPQRPDEFAAFAERLKTATRQYAKRQFTWFRKEPLFRWLNIEAHDQEIALDILLKDFRR